MSDENDKPYSWAITEDFERKVLLLDRENNRKTCLKLLSIQNLETQLKIRGATWLDRVQIPYEKDSFGKEGFGGELHRAVAKRLTWLVELGMKVEGIYTDRVELMSGPHAVVQTQRAFYLVPWRSVMEQERGRRVEGTMRGKSVSWQLGRGRGKGLSR